MLCLTFRGRAKISGRRTGGHTHFAIFYKKHIEWDEAAKVEDINIVFHSHLPGKHQGKIRTSEEARQEGKNSYGSRNTRPMSSFF